MGNHDSQPGELTGSTYLITSLACLPLIPVVSSFGAVEGSKEVAEDGYAQRCNNYAHRDPPIQKLAWNKSSSVVRGDCENSEGPRSTFHL